MPLNLARWVFVTYLLSHGLPKRPVLGAMFVTFGEEGKGGRSCLDHFVLEFSSQFVLLLVMTFQKGRNVIL